MEGAALSKVETSGLPMLQLTLQENSMDNNEEPITELGVTQDSACHCVQGGSDENSGAGAGAIAGSGADMMFVTTNSLSELVWSPHNGLSVKCADCSIDEKNPSILWGMESSNVVLPQSQSLTVRKINNEEKCVDIEIPSLSQIGLHFDCQVSDKVDLVRSSTTPLGFIPICKTTSLDQIPGLSRDSEVLTKKMEQSVTHIIKWDDHLVKKEKEICDPTDFHTIAGSFSLNMISNIPEKATIPGPDSETNAGSSLIKTVEVKLGLAHGNHEHNKGTTSNQFGSNREGDSESSHTASRSQQAPSPILTSPYKKGDKASVIQNEKNNKIIIEASHVTPEKQESTAENDLQPLEGGNKCAHTDEGIESEPDNDGKQNLHQLGGIFPKDEDVSAEASQNKNQIYSCQEKGEGKAKSNAEITGRNSGDEDDSHESVESCSSTGLFLARKRPWSYELQLGCGDKKMKKSHESPDPPSPRLRNSSFVNWISNMMKGVCKSHPDERPLALTMTPHHENGNCDQHFDLHGENCQSGSTAGFGSIFKAMYCPSISARDTGIITLDHQPRDGLKDLELANKTCSDSSDPMACGEDNGKSCKKTVILAEKFNQQKYESGDGHSGLPIISFKNFSLSHENNSSPTGINNSFDIAGGQGTGGLKSSNSSLQNDSDSASQGQEAKRFCLIDPNKSLNKMSSISGSLGSLWIARFFPKPSGHIINPCPCNHSSVGIFKGSTDCHRLLPDPLSSVVKDQSSFEDGRNPSTDDQVDVASRRMQNYAFNNLSLGSLKATEHSDQKCKPKLSIIRPSQRFKGSEAIASVFARRLDALRGIMPSETADNASHATTSCFFCGVKGHELKNCSEVTENELEDFLKKVNLFDGAGESSCFCVRCFQINHWAIACPKTLLRKRSHSDSSSLPDVKNFSKPLHIRRNSDLSNSDENSLPDIKSGECAVAHADYDGKKLRLSEEIVDDTDSKKKQSDVMGINDTISDFKLTKNDVVGNVFREGNPLRNTSKEIEFVLNQNKTASSFMENESKEDQVTALCNFVNRQIPAVPRGTFEAIKKLRLSRTDILKWMRSPVPLFCLDGFFLRLRLRKLEGLEGTGYYVACINGDFGERSEGTEIPLSVNIGGFKCLVESRFVSNHEFIEDELMAWWCATLKSGSELPSEADLRMKLEVRKNYGF